MKYSKYQMKPENMKMILGGKKVYRATEYYYNSCATDEDPYCRTLDHTITWYETYNIFGKKTGTIGEWDE